MSDYTIYHNPRCSKSRQTLQLLADNGIDPDVVLYLETPPTVQELTGLLSKLNIAPRQLLRKGEQAYKDLGLADLALADAVLLDAMCASPKLIERPIVVRGGSAVLGRPPENALSLINN